MNRKHFLCNTGELDILVSLSNLVTPLRQIQREGVGHVYPYPTLF
jgi:hypothetical protein